MLYLFSRTYTCDGLNSYPLEVTNPSLFSLSVISVSVMPCSARILSIATALLLLGLSSALALWYATADPTYQNDMYKDLTINNNSTNYGYNNEPDDAGPYFKGGYLGLTSGFYPGGWMTDYENVHAHVLFSFVKLILKDQETAASYGVGELERDTLIQRSTNSLRRLTDDGSEGTP